MNSKAKPVDQATLAKAGVGAAPSVNPLVVVGDKLPDYIKDDGKSRGNENVTIEDLVVPRVEVVQALSPCLDESNTAAHIAGAKQGDLFNSLTRRLYGKTIVVVPVMFRKQYLTWRDRDAGGGFRGAYDTLEQAAGVIKGLEKPEEWEAIDTGQHLALVLNQDGSVDEVMLSMAKTKMKVSRQWNSLVRQAGGDRFSRAYEIVGVKERNQKNQDYFNFAVRPIGFPPKEAYERAAALYEDLAAGKINVTMDTSDVDAATPGKSEF